jgi:hypothetical protein
MRLNRMNAPNTGSGTVDVNAVIRSTVPDPRLGADGRECELDMRMRVANGVRGKWTETVGRMCG